MTLFSLVTGYLVDKYLDSKNKVAIHQVKTDGKPETSMSCFAPGFEVNPADGENIIIQKVKGSSSFNVSIGGTNQNILPDTERGERRLYSVSEDGSEIKAEIHFKNTGEIETKNANGSIVLNPDGSTDLTMPVGAVYTMNFGPANKIEFSSSGMKITVAGVTYNALTHIHQTGVGPSSPPQPNT